MPNAIVPDSHENRLNFLINLKQKIAENVMLLNWDQTKLDTINALLDPLIGIYQTLVDAEQAVLIASANAAQLFAQQKGGLQALIAEIKANPGRTAGMLTDMEL